MGSSTYGGKHPQLAQVESTDFEVMAMIVTAARNRYSGDEMNKRRKYNKMKSDGGCKFLFELVVFCSMSLTYRGIRVGRKEIFIRESRCKES